MAKTKKSSLSSFDEALNDFGFNNPMTGNEVSNIDMLEDDDIDDQINNKSRIVAGYCWDWLKDGKNNSDVHDITIPEFGFEMSWNLGSTSTWAIDPESVKEAGCIHTCQGLEFDYVGVIIGPDMRYESGNIVTDASRRAKTDQSLKGLKSKYDKKDQAIVAARIIKNTYKVLMTRGMKGCYVYCTDKALSEYFRKRLSVSDIGKGL